MMWSMKLAAVATLVSMYVSSHSFDGAFVDLDKPPPWSVALLGGGVIKCGGTVVSTQPVAGGTLVGVLTAAHCYTKSPSELLFGSVAADGGVRVGLKGRTYAVMMGGDLALAQVVLPPGFRHSVEPLATAGRVSPDDALTVYLWGPHDTERLRRLSGVRWVDANRCQVEKVRRDPEGRSYKTVVGFCAGRRDGPDLRPHDSGGSLVAQDGDYARLVGVLSNGAGWVGEYGTPVWNEPGGRSIAFDTLTRCVHQHQVEGRAGSSIECGGEKVAQEGTSYLISIRNRDRGGIRKPAP